MTAESASPTPSSRYMADFFFSRRIAMLSGSTRRGWSSFQALTAGCSSRSVRKISMVACLDMDFAPVDDWVAPANNERFRDGRWHVRCHVIETSVFDLQQHIAVRQCAQTVSNQEGSAAAHQAFHRFHDRGLSLHIDRTGRLVQDQ